MITALLQAQQGQRHAGLSHRQKIPLNIHPARSWTAIAKEANPGRCIDEDHRRVLSRSSSIAILPRKDRRAERFLGAFKLFESDDQCFRYAATRYFHRTLEPSWGRAFDPHSGRIALASINRTVVMSPADHAKAPLSVATWTSAAQWTSDVSRVFLFVAVRENPVWNHVYSHSED